MGNYNYPDKLIKLKPSQHFVERLEQRGIGINCIPTLVRVTKDNIHSGKLENNYLTSVVVRLKYTYSRYIFLCFNPYDGTLKTVWFKDKFKNAEYKKESPTTLNSK